MAPTLAQKARANRDAALTYVRVQKRTLIQLTEFRLKTPVRRTIPIVGFASSRTAGPEGHAA